MKIATFNINSVNAHLNAFIQWLAQTSPDIVLLQEIKTEFNNFPFFEINAAGYQASVFGQKSYNGVAVLSKKHITVLQENLPNFSSDEARYLQVLYDDILLSSVYMPNGNPMPGPKFDTKIEFMQAFNAHAKELRKTYDKIIFGGDFNVILSKNDVYDEAPFAHNALTDETARKLLTELKYMGFYDAFRCTASKQNGYTYWDYGPSALANDFGMRIDYFFCSASMAQNLISCEVDKSLRQADRPSDHAPLVAEFLSD